MSGASLVATMQALSAQLAAFLALLLAVSAVHKASAWSRSLRVMREFGGVPASVAAAALALTVAVEFSAGVLLVIPAARAAGAVLAAGLWTLYLALILRAIVQKRRDLDCGCGFGTSARPLGAFQVARGGVLAVLALGIAGAASAAGSVPVQMSQVLGGMALLALYGALDQVMALQPLRSGEVL